MISLEKLRSVSPHLLFIGSHPGIIQSILDFDYLAERKDPSVVAIIASGRKFERYFFGTKEVLIPVFPDLSALPASLSNHLSFFVNVTSARRVLSTTTDILNSISSLVGGVIFAEDVPEKHALELSETAHKLDKVVIGPASVGLLIPEVLKLGAIGGTDYRQLIASHLFTPGSVAIFSASGGMTNEIIRIVTSQGKRVSFALHTGGDRFPVTTPQEAFLLAEHDPETKTIVYYGELGGVDEYEIARLITEKKITKKVLCYIAGTISDHFATPPQFGHAKAMAATVDEKAQSKREALHNAGAHVAQSFTEFVESIKNIEHEVVKEEHDFVSMTEHMSSRSPALITTSISADNAGTVTVLGEELLSFSQHHTFAYIVSSLFLGRQITSRELEEFVDFVLRLLVEHGPHVSGAMNTIVTARAGRDLVSALSAGLLTVGPRFGGAINEAAGNWLAGVTQNMHAAAFVESFAVQKKYIPGIGHRKYRSDQPDPRVRALLAFAEKLSEKRFTNFATEVEKVTVAKKGNLILNVDGTIAAVLLDMLSEKEGLTDQELQQLVETEFFNALFVLSRSVGFIAHFLDQKRLDEGLFRLPDKHVLSKDS